MEFGVFDHLDRHGGSLADYYESRLKIAEAYDRAGFYAYHLAEHHSTPLGHGAIAERVSRRRRAAHAQAAVRAAGLGDAAAPSAAADRGNLHARSAERRPARDRLRPRLGADRARILRRRSGRPRRRSTRKRSSSCSRGSTHKVLDFHGKRFSFSNVPMEIEPLQKPHPPIWYGVHAPDSAERAARRNLNVVSLDPPDETRLSIERYRTIWPQVHAADARRSPSSASAASSWWRRPTPRRWRWRAAPIWSGTRALRTCSGGTAARRSHPRPGDLRSGGRARPGHRRLAARRCRIPLPSQLAETGCNYVVGQFAFGDLTLAECLQSIGLFAGEVMPHCVRRRCTRGPTAVGVAAHVRR